MWFVTVLLCGLLLYFLKIDRKIIHFWRNSQRKKHKKCIFATKNQQIYIWCYKYAIQLSYLGQQQITLIKQIFILTTVFFDFNLHTYTFGYNQLIACELFSVCC